VEEGRLLDEAIDRHFSSAAPLASHKPLIYEIASGVIRWKLYLDWVLSRLAKEGVKKDVRRLLWMGLYQILFMKKAAYHVVNETVEHAKLEKGPGVANFVNAVLRRAIREKGSMILPADPVLRLSVEYSFPEWLAARWSVRFGTEAARDLLATLNKNPSFALRVNSRKVARDEAMSMIAGLGLKVEKGRILPLALNVDRVGPLIASGLLENRLVYVQDEASQLAGLAVAPRPGDLLLDACAGQGTKTDQIIESWPQTHVLAMDKDGTKLRNIAGTACRVRGDILRSPFKKGGFDSILLDAPCSSLGIIRKHPEIKWRRAERDIAAFGAVQADMLRSAHGVLKEGGRLVYSVCSFEPEETTDVMEKVIKEGLFTPEPPLPAIGGDTYFLSLPHLSGMDGFFIARLRKA
jgi:16S rRNA (cytosine967-C5)-methyltransferase